MKRCIISACLIMVCSLVFAQVKVGSDGKVAIGTDTAAPLSILSVNSKPIAILLSNRPTRWL